MLKKNYEFKKVLSKGKYFSGVNIEAFIVKNKETDKNYIGLAISTKIGKAVIRNNIKRLIRENYKNIEDSIKYGYSMVFLWKKNITTENANYKNIEKDIINIFDKADMIQNKE